ncbi:MAG: alanine racemase [Candidatus Aminicenantes bacterium]|nr:alanine racemase [Candidatus Aminicenantes bacterium]
MEYKDLNTWIEISESAYAQNMEFFKKRVSSHSELSAVVKANAYGHGICEIAGLAVKHGADSLSVHSLDEALLLRESGFLQDILIMGPVALYRLSEVIKNNFRLGLFNLETLKELTRLTQEMGQRVRIHLKLETGTYRLGINEQELKYFLEILKNSPFITLEAAYTHFANIEDTTNHSYAYYQIDRFEKMISQIRSTGFPKIKKHAACSAATLLFPETHFDMVRLGISQYGLWPSRETFVSYKIKHTKNGEDVLQPVLTWKTRVGQIKHVPANYSIGYGRTYQTTRESRVAVLPIGYSDGYDRRLSNQSHVLIRGRRAPLRGRVCMNLIMVDITDNPGVQLEDEVVLLGSQGNETITADYLAGLISTINYEVTTRISQHIPRIVTPI